MWTPVADLPSAGALASNLREAIATDSPVSITPTAYLIGQREGAKGVMTVKIESSSDQHRVASGKLLREIASEIDATAMVLVCMTDGDHVAVVVEQSGACNSSGDRYGHLAVLGEWAWNHVLALAVRHLSGVVARVN